MNKSSTHVKHSWLTSSLTQVNERVSTSLLHEWPGYFYTLEVSKEKEMRRYLFYFKPHQTLATLSWRRVYYSLSLFRRSSTTLHALLSFVFSLTCCYLRRWHSRLSSCVSGDSSFLILASLLPPSQLTSSVTKEDSPLLSSLYPRLFAFCCCECFTIMAETWRRDKLEADVGAVDSGEQQQRRLWHFQSNHRHSTM